MDSKQRSQSQQLKESQPIDVKEVKGEWETLSHVSNNSEIVLSKPQRILTR